MTIKIDYTVRHCSST